MGVPRARESQSSELGQAAEALGQSSRRIQRAAMLCDSRLEPGAGSADLVECPQSEGRVWRRNAGHSVRAAKKEGRGLGIEYGVTVRARGSIAELGFGLRRISSVAFRWSASRIS